MEPRCHSKRREGVAPKFSRKRSATPGIARSGTTSFRDRFAFCQKAPSTTKYCPGACDAHFLKPSPDLPDSFTRMDLDQPDRLSPDARESLSPFGGDLRAFRPAPVGSGVRLSPRGPRAGPTDEFRAWGHSLCLACLSMELLNVPALESAPASVHKNEPRSARFRLAYQNGEQISFDRKATHYAVPRHFEYASFPIEVTDRGSGQVCEPTFTTRQRGEKWTYSIAGLFENLSHFVRCGCGSPCHVNPSTDAGSAHGSPEIHADSLLKKRAAA